MMIPYDGVGWAAGIRDDRDGSGMGWAGFLSRSLIISLSVSRTQDFLTLDYTETTYL